MVLSLLHRTAGGSRYIVVILIAIMAVADAYTIKKDEPHSGVYINWHKNPALVAHLKRCFIPRMMISTRMMLQRIIRSNHENAAINLKLRIRNSSRA
jgi:hypothetical protein